MEVSVMKKALKIDKIDFDNSVLIGKMIPQNLMLKIKMSTYHSVAMSI